MNFHAEERAGAVELFLFEACENVGDWQAERINRKQRGVVERDQCAAALDELAQSLDSTGADSANVFTGDRAGGEAVQH